jgi:hypothetical protein
MNLVICHEFYGRIGENTQECCRMTLEESTKPAVSINFETSTKGTAPRSYDIMRFVTKLRSGYKLHTCILLKVWVGGLKKNLDSVKRSDNSLRLRSKEVNSDQEGGRKTYDTPSSSTSQTRTDDVVKRLFFWLGGCSTGTHSQSQKVIKVNYTTVCNFQGGVDK